MSTDEIAAILEQTTSREDRVIDKPTAEDWARLEHKFGTIFSDEIKAFIDLMSVYHFPGDILNARESGQTNGNDTISFTYEFEMKQHWEADLIPFYAIGNGDYFCVSAKEGRDSAVYYWRHDDHSASKENASFAEWVKALPEFLS